MGDGYGNAPLLLLWGIPAKKKGTLIATPIAARVFLNPMRRRFIGTGKPPIRVTKMPKNVWRNWNKETSGKKFL